MGGRWQFEKYSIIIVTHFFPRGCVLSLHIICMLLFVMRLLYLLFSTRGSLGIASHTSRNHRPTSRRSLVLLPFFRYVTSSIKLAEIARDNSDRKWNNAFLIIKFIRWWSRYNIIKGWRVPIDLNDTHTSSFYLSLHCNNRTFIFLFAVFILIFCGLYRMVIKFYFPINIILNNN